MNLFRKIRHLHYKELFLIGFYVSFIAITLLAALIDTFFEAYIDIAIDLVAVCISILFFLYYRRSNNLKVAARAIFWLGSIVTFIFMVHSNFNIIVAFAILLPIAACVMMTPKETFINVLLFYIALTLLLIYGYRHYVNHPFLHDPQELATYGIAMLFTVAFGLFYNFSIENSHQSLERANAEKEILLKEIHHRVKNNLNVIASIVDLQARTNDRAFAKELHLTQGRIESIAIVHEMLYQKQQDLAQIDFQDYMHKLALMVERLHMKHDVDYHIEGHGALLPISTMLDLGLITNELLTNTHKHAFAETLAPSITVELKPTTPGCYRYRYCDNGCGIDAIETIMEGKSLGLRLIRLSAQKMDATLRFQGDEGFSAMIDFDLAATLA